jgi:hypothetical protein
MLSALEQALLGTLTDRGLAELAARLAPHLPQVRVDDDGYVNAEEAGRYLGLSRKRIYDLKVRGLLQPDGYDGRTPLWRRATLDAYVQARPRANR